MPPRVISVGVDIVSTARLGRVYERFGEGASLYRCCFWRRDAGRVGDLTSPRCRGSLSTQGLQCLGGLGVRAAIAEEEGKRGPVPRVPVRQPADIQSPVPSHWWRQHTEKADCYLASPVGRRRKLRSRPSAAPPRLGMLAESNLRTCLLSIIMSAVAAVLH